MEAHTENGSISTTVNVGKASCLKRIDTELPGVCVIEPEVFEDSRGGFFETYHREKFTALGIDAIFVQENQSVPAKGFCAASITNSLIRRPSYAESWRVKFSTSRSTSVLGRATSGDGLVQHCRPTIGDRFSFRVVSHMDSSCARSLPSSFISAMTSTILKTSAA